MPGGLISRRKSLALDEAEAVEARRVAGIADEDSFADETAGDAEDEESVKPSDTISQKLAAKFAAKDDAKKKQTRKGKGKAEEVGPSGLTYTPLEKQFMEIKAANPDVLLLMEGEELHPAWLILVGYKYKFHGDDAKKASKELGIAA